MPSLKHNTENTDKDQTLNMQDCFSVSRPGVGRGRPVWSAPTLHSREIAPRSPADVYRN